jgi:hypothetical protein
MKILSPLLIGQKIIIIPRKYINGAVKISLKNEENNEVLENAQNQLTINGYMYIPINESFINNSNYQITVFEEFTNEIIYRGKLFVTDQSNETQEYKITKDIFTF